MKLNPCHLALAFAAFAGFLPATSHAALVLLNGDFQDLGGLSSLGGGWYSGVSAGWTGPNTTYTVGTASSGNTVANLEHAANTTGTFAPLYQDLGTLDAASTVSLTFTVLQPWTANVAQAGAAIWSGAGFTSTLISQSDIAPGTYTLIAENVPAGTDIRIGFWRSRSSNSPGLDNVSITVTPVPEPSAFAAAGGLALLGVGVRRRTA